MNVQARSAGDGTFTAKDGRNAIAIALLCAIFILLRWKKMESLLWLDPARWLNEFARTAQGELPYRDFSFQYPPFVIFLYGWLMRWFGITFTTAQVITDVIDVLMVLFCVELIRRLIPAGLRLATAICVVVVCSTSLMFFNLFSFVTYIPSLQSGALGILMVLIALLSYLRTGRLSGGEWTILTLGGFIACLSKPEFILASIAAIAMLGLLRRNFAFLLVVAAAVFVPSAIVYVIVGKAVGFSELRAGIAGYGLATAACPWWPTGLGIFGGAAALGEALAFAALVSLPVWKSFANRFGKRYYILLSSAVAGGVVFAAYIAYRNMDALRETLSLTERARRILPTILFTSSVLQPVLWVSIIVSLVLLWRLFRGRQIELRHQELLLVLAATVTMAVRSLFGSTLSEFPEVAAVCYPFFLILGAYFLWHFLSSAATPRYSAAVVMTVLLGYACLRVAGAWPGMLSDKAYGTLQTPAGSVRLVNHKVDTEVYDYLMANTQPGDYVLDMPYGGGLNFATGRRSPIYTTQLNSIGWSPMYQQRDVDLLQRRPAKVVIAINDAKLGTFWGFGPPGNRLCVCPRLVWQPDIPNWDPNYVFPLVSYVKEHYHVAATIGDKLILTPNQP